MRWWVAFAAAWLGLCLPLLLVDVPPLGDYPNHLARAFVLAHLDDPAFAAVYQAHWAIIPDLAIDSFMPWLVTVLPVRVAGRLLLALILLLDLLGATACAAALFGQRTWWSLAAALVAYHYAFLQGFLNFDLTFAAAMLLAAGWMRLRPHAWAAALFGSVSAALLFFGHLMGLVFFGLLIGSFEAASLLPLAGEGRDGGGSRTGRAAGDTLTQPSPASGRGLLKLLQTWPLLVTAIPPAILYPLSGLHGAGGETIWLPWRWRLMEVIAAVTNYDWTLDVLTALAMVLLLAGCALAGRLRVARGAVVAIMLLAVLFPIMPNDLKGTSLVAVRLAIMLGFLAVIAVRPVLPVRLATLAFCAFAALFAVRMGVVATAWWGYRTDVANIRNLIARIQPGDRVTQMDIDRFDEPHYHDKAPTAWRMSDGLWTESHLMALVVIERRAFWTNMFVNPDQQPLVFRPGYQALAESGRSLPAYADLKTRRVNGYPPGANPFCAFDWIVLQGTWAEPHPETLSPDWLALVAGNQTAALYKPRCQEPVLP